MSTEDGTFWLWFLQTSGAKAVYQKRKSKWMKWNKLYLELNLHALWPAWTGQWCRNGMTRGGSRTSKCWRALASLCRGLSGASRQQFITCLLSMEKHFVLITGVLTASVFHCSIANESVSLMLAWCLADQLRELLLRRLAVSGERYCSAVCNMVTTCCISRASLRV